MPKMREPEFLMSLQGQRLLNGIAPLLAESGIGAMQMARLSEIQGISNVRNVELNLKQRSNLMLNFVQQNAKTDTICESIEHSENGTRIKNALFVRKHFRHTGGRRHKLVVKNVQLLSENIEPEVYDLHIDQYHEYFANGILVHNCSDSSDYFLTTIFASYMNKYSKQQGMRRVN